MTRLAAISKNDSNMYINRELDISALFEKKSLFLLDPHSYALEKRDKFYSGLHDPHFSIQLLK